MHAGFDPIHNRDGTELGLARKEYGYLWILFRRASVGGLEAIRVVLLALASVRTQPQDFRQRTSPRLWQQATGERRRRPRRYR